MNTDWLPDEKQPSEFVILDQKGTKIAQGKFRDYPFYDKHGGLYNEQFWNKSGICWSLIASCKNSFRLKDAIFHYSSASPTIISNNKDLDLAVLGFLNSKVTTYLLNMFNPTLNTTVSAVLNLPFKCFDSKAIALNVDRNINYAKKDWDSFETSWDFKKHPLI